MEPFELVFSTHKRAWAVRAEETATPERVAAALNLARGQNVCVLSSGAGAMSDAVLAALRETFAVLAGYLAGAHITTLDGGTASGGMALLARALADTPMPAPYIGTLPAHAPVDDTRSGEEILEPQHSHFVLLEQSEWGSEVPLMSALAGYLSVGCASITVLVNGGGIALKDIRQSIAARRPVIVLAGTGRLADEIARAMRHPAIPIRRAIAEVARSGLVSLVDVPDAPSTLIGLMDSIFSGRERRRT